MKMLVPPFYAYTLIKTYIYPFYSIFYLLLKVSITTNIQS